VRDRSERVVTHRIRALRDVAVPPLKIAMIADLHACRPGMAEDRIARIVAQANGLGADLICLLGDYPGHTRGTTPLTPDEVVPLLTALRAPLGVVAIMGNHDWLDDLPARRGEIPETRWHRAFRDAGLTTLHNAATTLRKDGLEVTLAGLDSQMAHGRKRPGADDFASVSARIDPGRFTILLAHEPDIFPDLPDHVDLTLSGHMHGGQVRIFGRALYCPSRHGTRYDLGHFREGTRQLVVSGGLGNSLLPIRFGIPPAITVVDIG